MIAGAVATLAVVVTSTAGSGLADPAPVAAPQPGDPGGPIILGVAGGQLPTKTTTRIDTFQSKAGRTMGAVRMYGLWDSTFPDVLSSYAKTNGQAVLLSVKAKTGKGAIIPWATIANAKPAGPNVPKAQSDAYANLLRWSTQIKNYGVPIFFTFNHEPEEATNDRMGSAADFIAAWRRIVTVFQQQNVRNVEYAFISTAYGYKRGDRRAAKNYYPGDDYVDDIAADGYNWYTCRATVKNAWASPAQIFGAFTAFGAQHPDKGMVIAEFGSVEDPAVPGRKAQWFTDMRNLLEQPGHGQFRVAAEWYPQNNVGCNFTIDSSPSALDSFRAFGADPTYASASVTPAIPRQIVVSKPNAGSARIAWQAGGPGGASITGYTLRVVETGETFSVGPDASSYTYTPGSGGNYAFTVAATNAAGEGRRSVPTAAVALG